MNKPNEPKPVWARASYFKGLYPGMDINFLNAAWEEGKVRRSKPVKAQGGGVYFRVEDVERLIEENEESPGEERIRRRAERKARRRQHAAAGAA